MSAPKQNNTTGSCFLSEYTPFGARLVREQETPSKPLLAHPVTHNLIDCGERLAPSAHKSQPSILSDPLLGQRCVAGPSEAQLHPKGRPPA